ncbi:MAG: hypothetical protein ACLQPD_04835 [Desulfomonilaceae bacterium]
MGNIPDSIKDIFEKIKERAMLVQLHWKIYNDLFNRSQLRTDMLNECDPAFFSLFQIALVNEIIMSLSRLTDRPGTGDRQRLSFEKLHGAISISGDDAFSQDLKDKIENIREKCKKIREYRNNYLAHLDYRTIMHRLRSTDPVTIKMIGEAVEAFNDYMSTLEEHYQPGTEVKYAVSFTVSGDHIIWLLKNGLHLQELVDDHEISDSEFYRGKWRDA